ncbi:hypothetical protein Tco_0985277 [Tanacetum coccineum]
MEQRRTYIVFLYTFFALNIACATMDFKNVTLPGQHPAPDLVAHDVQRSSSLWVRTKSWTGTDSVQIFGYVIFGLIIASLSHAKDGLIGCCYGGLTGIKSIDLSAIAFLAS